MRRRRLGRRSTRRRQPTHSGRLKQVNVDTTVREKNVTRPTDSKLYYKAIVTLGNAAKRRGLRLRQTYLRVAKHAAIKASRCHAKPFRRVRRQLRFLWARLGRMLRDIERNVAHPDPSLAELLELCGRLHRQQPHDRRKLHAWTSPR